ncbi:hypothetical protein ACFVW8_15260 [Streptomyces sp. NPDC058221]|uniref:hypothetical protein n=1 Tax=Streptomyces sp. NPDC058221 TaxID=3346388 RepID=UPI0036E2ADD0
MMRQHMKLTVVLVAVVLALTGFSSSSHGSKSKSRKSSSSSGGGCSNSKKSNGSYHRTNRNYGSSSGSTSGSNSSRSTPSATATSAPRAYVFRCATPAKGASKAVTTSTVRLTASASGSHTYEVNVSFLDAMGTAVDTGVATVQANGGQTKTVSVPMVTPSQVYRVKKCSVTATLNY